MPVYKPTYRGSEKLAIFRKQMDALRAAGVSEPDAIKAAREAVGRMRRISYRTSAVVDNITPRVAQAALNLSGQGPRCDRCVHWQRDTEWKFTGNCSGTDVRTREYHKCSSFRGD